MSRATAGIFRINEELQKISGLDGIVADKIEALETQVRELVFDILENHSEASLFDYLGKPSLKIDEILNQIDESPILDEVLKDGERLAIDTFDTYQGEIKIKIIKYKNDIYYIKYEDEKSISFRQL